MQFMIHIYENNKYILVRQHRQPVVRMHEGQRRLPQLLCRNLGEAVRQGLLGAEKETHPVGVL
jgi:hypothetical protein